MRRGGVQKLLIVMYARINLTFYLVIIAAAVRADSICVYCGPRSAAGFYVLWNASLVGLVQGSPNVH